MKLQKIILASSSSYRKALLARLQLPFSSQTPDIDESPLPNEDAKSLVLRLAENKAKKIAETHSNAIIISSDQVATQGEKLIGKPLSKVKAKQQLMRVSNEKITFYTSVCVLNTATQHQQIAIEPFTVTFRQLTEQMVANYLAKEPALDCAGSFKAEGLGIALFSKMEGSDPTALQGLPLIRLVQMLANENIHVI